MSTSPQTQSGLAANKSLFSSPLMFCTLYAHSTRYTQHTFSFSYSLTLLLSYYFTLLISLSLSLTLSLSLSLSRTQHVGHSLHISFQHSTHNTLHTARDRPQPKTPHPSPENRILVVVDHGSKAIRAELVIRRYLLSSFSGTVAVAPSREVAGDFWSPSHELEEEQCCQECEV